MRRLFAGVVCLLALCGCDSAPQNPVDAAIVNPATLSAPAATPPPRVAHEGSRIGAVFLPVAPGSATALNIDSDRGRGRRRRQGRDSEGRCIAFRRWYAGQFFGRPNCRRECRGDPSQRGV
jgi:hypothetical protein